MRRCSNDPPFALLMVGVTFVVQGIYEAKCTRGRRSSDFAIGGSVVPTARDLQLRPSRLARPVTVPQGSPSGFGARRSARRQKVLAILRG